MTSSPTPPPPPPPASAPGGLSPSAHVDTFTREHLPAAGLWPKLEFTLPELRYPPRLNAAVEILDVSAARFGAQRPALRTPDGETWSYGLLRERSDRIAEVLAGELALLPGQRVLLRGPNTPWTVAAWFAVLKAGGVVVTTTTALRAFELAPVLARTRPSVALVDHRFTEEVRTARDSSWPALKVLAYGGTSARDLTARAAAASGRFRAVETAADDVALLGPTSGSTGVPKITMHFHRDLLSVDHTFGRPVLRLAADDVVACSAPLAFTFGLGMLVVFPLRAGACALLTESATPARLARLVRDEEVSVLATAPTAYRAILRAGLDPLLAGLRAAVSAGEHLPRATWEEAYARLGLRIIDGIGATELLHIFISASGEEIRPGATGRPVPGYRAAILGPDGSQLGPGQAGRLAVVGPVGCRYLDDPRQAEYVLDGWNLTGDLYTRDEDGYYTYLARSDSMIVSSGYNIGGPEVETAIDTHPDVVECGVVGRPDPERGSVVCAFVVLREGVAGDAAKAREIQDHVKAVLAPYKYPRDVRFRAALPRNTSGKLQRFALRALLEAEHEAEPIAGRDGEQDAEQDTTPTNGS